MKTKYVLISGPTIVLDMELEQALHECAVILKNADNPSCFKHPSVSNGRPALNGNHKE